MSSRLYLSNTQAGFILIETLLAVAIVSSIGLLIVMSFVTTFRTADELRMDQERDHEARLGLSIIANDIVASTYDSRFPWTGLDRALDGEASDVLSVMTRAPSRAGKNDETSDAVRIVYSREGDRLLRWIMPNIYGVPKGRIFHSEIARNVVSFNVRYYDPLMKLWTDSWLGSSVLRVPLAVMITITMNQVSKRPHTYTQWLTIPTQEHGSSSKI